MDINEEKLQEIISILNGLGMKVFIIGARALELRGVSLNRETGDWDIFIDKPYTPEVRDILTKEFRKLGINVQWRKWGIRLEFSEFHVNIYNIPLTFDEEFLRRCISTNNVYLPSLEDLIILKLMSGEAKDIKDIKKIFNTEGVELELNYLMKRAREAGLEKTLYRLLKRMGFNMGVSR